MDTKEKQIQVPASFFMAVAKYFEIGNGADDHSDEAEKIRKQVKEKLTAHKKRSLYSKSKDPLATPEEREAARQEYLDMAGVRSDFRWSQKYQEKKDRP